MNILDTPGIRDLLDQFGDDAAKLNADLRQIGDHAISSRLVAIASVLWIAYAKGALFGIPNRNNSECLQRQKTKGR